MGLETAWAEDSHTKSCGPGETWDFILSVMGMAYTEK